MSEAPVFERHEDGSVTVDRDWPEEIVIADEMLVDEVVSVTVRFMVANGFAAYRLTSFDGRTYTARLVNGDWKAA